MLPNIEKVRPRGCINTEINMPFVLGIVIGIVIVVYAGRIATKYNFKPSQKIWLGRGITMAILLTMIACDAVTFVTYILWGMLLVNMLTLHPWKLRDIDIADAEVKRKEDIIDTLNNKKKE